MIRLDVWVTLPNGERHHAGELITSDPNQTRGAIQGEFRYSEHYLALPSAFALDPQSLPLKPGVFAADRPTAGIHAVFEDALPDDWGRRLLVHRYRLRPTEQRAPNLLRCLGDNGMGALSFGEGSLPPRTTQMPDHSVEQLLEVALAFDAGESVVEADLSTLFAAGSSPGGARPKAVVHDNNRHWIAKFPRVKDTFDVVRLEAATMALAQHSGLEVPQFKVMDCGEHAAFLIQRFDITEHGRRHMISMQTLLKADNYYVLSYSDIAEVLRRYSANPSTDLEKLYRQMIFNALIGNTDDHLKNFAMLHDDSGYHLSPAFDLIPNIGSNSEHVLRFGLSATAPKRQEVIGMAKAFNLGSAQANSCLDAILCIISQWREVFHEHQVPEQDKKRLQAGIEQRINNLQAH